MGHPGAAEVEWASGVNRPRLLALGVLGRTGCCCWASGRWRRGHPRSDAGGPRGAMREAAQELLPPRSTGRAGTCTLSRSRWVEEHAGGGSRPEGLQAAGVEVAA